MNGLLSAGFAILILAVCCQQAVNGYSYPTYYVEEDLCPGHKMFSNMGAITVKLTKFSTYGRNLNCMATFSTSPGRRLMAEFRSLAIEDSVTCSRDRLRMYDGPSSQSPPLTGSLGLCGFHTPSKVYVTSQSAITLFFTSDSSVQYSGFTLILTDFKSTCSNGTSFRCRNNRCIDNYLTCDGWNNCGDNTDEIEGCGLSVGGVAGLAVGGFFVLVILCTVLVVCRRRRTRRYIALMETAGRPTYSVTQTTCNTPQHGYPNYQQQGMPAGAYQPPPPGAYPQK